MILSKELYYSSACIVSQSTLLVSCHSCVVILNVCCGIGVMKNEGYEILKIKLKI